MTYSANWINKNLGISRDTIRYYEEKGLISKRRNPRNNYCEYTDDDLARIWGIQILHGIGYSVEEILEMKKNSSIGFYDTISKKVKELEKKCALDFEYLGFAKTIKVTGRIPTVNEQGSINFSDFIEYVKENWNIYTEPKVAQYTEMLERLVEIDPDKYTAEQLAEAKNRMPNVNYEEMVLICMGEAYCRLIAELRFMKSSSEPVQAAVKLLYEHVKQYSEKELTPRAFMERILSPMMDGDASVWLERDYGKEGKMFIIKAIWDFGTGS